METKTDAPAQLPAELNTESLMAMLIAHEPTSRQQLLRDFITVISYRAGACLTRPDVHSIAESYLEALREANVDLGGRADDIPRQAF